MTSVVYRSTKTYTHASGLSCCFRQWRADSHCNQLHGYALQVKATFEAKALDHRGWVVDFGGLKEFKEYLIETFDHKLLIADDDPMKQQIYSLEGQHERYRKAAATVILPAVGCEAFAYMIFTWLDEWTQRDSNTRHRVRVFSVEVSEHEGNSAIVQVHDQPRTEAWR